MTWPEPSKFDCGALWNLVTVEDEDGNEYETCGCYYCSKRARTEAEDDFEEPDDNWRDNPADDYYNG